MLQDFFVDLLIDRLVLWQELTEDDTPYIEEHDQHDFNCLAFLGFGNFY